MKIFLLEFWNNKEIYNYLKDKYYLVNTPYSADVVLINKVYNVKTALEIVDYMLNSGKEIICIKNRFSKENYVSNYLIKNGAIYI